MTRPSDSAIWGPGVAQAPASQRDILLDQLRRAAADDRTGTYVVFPYCVSVVVLSFKRSSGIVFVAEGSSRLVAGVPYLLTSLFDGWWGIPWGIFWTAQSIVACLRGGRDLTPAINAIRAELASQASAAAPVPG